MELLFRVSELMATLLDGFGAIVFLSLICGRRKNINTIIYVIGTVSFSVAVSFFPVQIRNILGQVIIVFLLSLLYEVFFLEQGIGKKIYFNIIWNVILMLSNMIAVYGIAFILKLSNNIILESGSIERVLVLIVNKIILLFLASLFIYYNDKHKLDYKHCAVTVILFIGTITIGIMLVKLYVQDVFAYESEKYLVLISIALFAMSFGICVCQHIINIQDYYKIENERMKMHLEEEEKYIQKIQEIYENTNIIKHDIKHYIVVIGDLLKQKKYDDIDKILDGITKDWLSKDNVFLTSNRQLNSVLNHKIITCRENNIDLEINMTCVIPEKITINVCVILSNLLDNAIEAEKKEEDKQIKLNISNSGQMINIKLQNKISESILAKNATLESTKTDKHQHGFGLKSVEKRVKQMDGIYYVKEECKYFQTIIYIPV